MLTLENLSLQESELAELRETIESLKTQNTDAQTAIQVALNGPDHLHKGNEETAGDVGPNFCQIIGSFEEALNASLLHEWMHFLA